MTLVVDASTVFVGLVDSTDTGAWAEERLGEDQLAAPHLMTVEAPNILRWAELAGEITGDTAALAYADLLDLAVDLYPFELVAERVWRLRTTVAAYNAWYVALAELVDAPLATLDTKLAKAAGPQCEFRTPF